MRFTLILAGIMMLCTSLHAQEEMYKWTNDAGVVQYSQFPPKGVAASRVEKVGGKKKSAQKSLADIENSDDLDVSADAGNDSLDVEDEVETAAITGEDALANAEKLAAAEKERVRKEEEKICEIATKNLIGLESRPIVRVRDGDDYRVLTRSEKEAKLTETREQITKYCG